MARISERDAERLGIGARISGAVAAAALGRSRTAGVTPTAARAPRAHPKSGRLPMRDPADPRPVAFVVETDPVPKERARTQLPKGQIVKCFVQARGNLQTFQALLDKLKHQTYTPDRTAGFEREVALVARRAMAKASREPLSVAVSMTVTFVLRGDPDTWPTDQSDGDLDNLAKSIKDALTGIAYTDDRLVVAMNKIKVCDRTPRIEVALAAAQRVGEVMRTASTHLATEAASAAPAPAPLLQNPS